MPDGLLRVYADHSQTRVRTTPNTIAALAFELCGETLSDNVMLDPVTKTLMLRPSVLTVDWYTTNTGITLKNSIASGYEVKTSARWDETEVFLGAGKFVRCDDTSSNEYIRTSVVPGINRPVHLTYFAFSAGDKSIICECGWSNSTTPSAETATLGFKIWSDGVVQMYKGGTLLTEGKISGSKAAQGTQNETVTIIFLPCRRRDMVVFGSGGDGFVWTFDDIDEDETAPEITPAEKFFVAPNTSDPNFQVQFGACKFPSTANAISEVYQFGTPPLADQDLFEDWQNPVFTGITTASIYGDTAYAGTTDVDSATLRDENDTADFVADGVSTSCRTKVVLSGDGDYTPFIYGAVWEYRFVHQQTNASEEFELGDYIREVSLSVPDDPTGATLNVTCYLEREVEVDGIESQYLLESEVPNATTQSYRPVSAETDPVTIGGNTINGCQLFDGYVSRPRLTDAIRDRVKVVEWTCLSIEALLNEYQFTSRVPFDGMPLCKGEGAFSAVGYVLERCGIPADRHKLSDLDYVISEVPAKGGDDWNLAAEVGDTGRDVLDKLHKLAADCVYGSHPGGDGKPEFWFLAPEDLPTDPVVTLYRTEEDVEALEPWIPAEERVKYLYHSYNDEVLAIEANVVRATGLDPRTDKIIQSYAIDLASVETDAAPSARPANWVGHPLVVGVASRQFRSTRDTDRVVQKLLPIATEQGTVCEFDANTMICYSSEGVGATTGYWLPLWRMDVVHLDGIGDVRISSLNVRFVKDVEEGQRGEGIVRVASYTGGTPRGRGGTTIESIQRYQQMRLARRGYQESIRTAIVASPAKSVSVVS
jgi:hypothetical protein